MPKRVLPAKDVPFGGFHNSRLHLGGKTPKTSPKWAEIGISQPNQRSSKIAIYRLLMKILASNFTERLITGNIIEEMQN